MEFMFSVYILYFSVIPWHVDWIYYRTAHGKKYSQTCDYVHGIADDIIRQRRKVLVIYFNRCVCVGWRGNATGRASDSD